MGGNNEFFENLERNKYLKKKNYPACKELILNQLRIPEMIQVSGHAIRFEK